MNFSRARSQNCRKLCVLKNVRPCMARVISFIFSGFSLTLIAFLLQADYYEWKSYSASGVLVLCLLILWLGSNLLLVGVASAHDTNIFNDVKWSWITGKDPSTGSFNAICFVFWLPFSVLLQFYVHVIFRRLDT